MTRALYLIEWGHADIGLIREYTCERHRELVGRALSTLGLGSITTRPPVYSDCHRCARAGEMVRGWLRTRVVRPQRA